MKKALFSILLVFLFFLGLFFILNIKATTRQGVNYKVETLKIPLYLKILDFYDRHYNYLWLVSRITTDKLEQRDKVMALFKWTHENIQQQPREWRIVDDHVWHIIVRGYGTGDQFSDVFTTLCNYVNTDAFFFRLGNKDRTSRITFAFVKIAGKWRLFEPRAGVCFINKEGDFASIEEIAKGNWFAVGINDSGKIRPDYAEFFSEISTINPEEYHRFSRANIQSPLNRFIYGLKKKIQTK